MGTILGFSTLGILTPGDPSSAALLLHTTVLILTTCTLHGVATSALISLTTRYESHHIFRPGSFLRNLLVPALVLALLGIALLEALIWATYYVHAELIDGLKNALYFSLVTLTTLGYGDITLSGEGRLLSGIQAALGIVLFGWTTAIIIAAVQLVSFSKKTALKGPNLQLPVERTKLQELP